MNRAAPVVLVVLFAIAAVQGYAQDSASGIPTAAAAPGTPSVPEIPAVPTIPSAPSIPALPAIPVAQKGLVLSGNLEADYALFGNRAGSPLFELQSSGRSVSNYTASYLLDFYLDGDYQSGGVGIHFKTETEYSPDDAIDFNIFELYGDLSLSDSSYLQVGKREYSWGKGYAFNPVGYVNPKKDPTNPGLEQPGLASISYQYSKSLASKTLSNIAADIIVIPSQDLLGNGVSEIENTAVAAKLYFLLWDTDIDLMSYDSRADGEKGGFDFSRNIVSNLEVHGELSYFRDEPDHLILNGTVGTQRVSGLSYLVGLRWLNRENMTTIMEYYHDGAGMTGEEFASYLAFLSSALNSGSSSAAASAMDANRSYFSALTQMRDYLYVNLSWPQPFNLLDFTPGAFAIYNIYDESLAAGVPLVFSPVTNFTLTLRPIFFVGASGTEFGSKPYWGKVDVEAEFSF